MEACLFYALNDEAIPGFPDPNPGLANC
jgi:hypothetical protein